MLLLVFHIHLWVSFASTCSPLDILNSGDITKWNLTLPIPPTMPMSRRPPPYTPPASYQGPFNKSNKYFDYYEIAVRQFQQQILPYPFDKTTVWGYGAIDYPGTLEAGGSFHSPALTIEAFMGRPVKVKWINDLVDSNGNYLPHLLTVDQTLHWANPPGHRDTEGTSLEPYTGPVPIITHLHGGLSQQEHDGHPEAWYLPNAKNLDDEFWPVGSKFDYFKQLSENGDQWQNGSVVFSYANNFRAGTLWFHDHALGITRLNVYTGPAGFYLLRDRQEQMLNLPGPAPPPLNSNVGNVFEIPIAIQDRVFLCNAALFYPESRRDFDPLPPNFPFKGQPACNGCSDVPPFWNPEVFGNVLISNGAAWPTLSVSRRRYRFRLLNGCNSRTLILSFRPGTNLNFWVIASDAAGFLPAPVETDLLLMGSAERYDVIVDFSLLPNSTTEIILFNLGPDVPYNGTIPVALTDLNLPQLAARDTGQVLKFCLRNTRVRDSSARPQTLSLPPVPFPVINPSNPSRELVTLLERDSQTVLVSPNNELDCVTGTPFGPVKTLLGTGRTPFQAHNWSDPVTEKPILGEDEIWAIRNFTPDMHPIHLHDAVFQVLDRQPIDPQTGEVTAPARPPQIYETGLKETVLVTPMEVTRIAVSFAHEGQFVWHCHILEHEDNEMMRPLEIQPNSGGTNY